MSSIKCFIAMKITGKILTYLNTDTLEEFEMRVDDPRSHGALWRRQEMEDYPMYCGVDAQCWQCMTPGGEWAIDGRASNCTMKDDDNHKCWCRHGKAPNFTVDKNGTTCGAGAGSILVGTYHGFLRNGYLESC